MIKNSRTMRKIKDAKFSLRQNILIYMICAVLVIASTHVIAEIEGSNPDLLVDENIIMKENFEHDGEMPSDWTVIKGIDRPSNPEYNWHIVGPGGEFVHSGEYAAKVARCPFTHQDEWLISPEIDLRAYDPETTNITVVFWIRSQNTTDSTGTLHVLGEGGLDDIIWNQDDEWWDEYEYREIGADTIGNLDPYIGSVIQLAWRYEGIHGRNFGLDDIKVFAGDYVPPPENPELEIGAVTGRRIITVDIKNTGDPDGDEYERTRDVVNVRYRITMTGGIRAGIDVTDSGTIEKIEAGEQETTSFTGFFGLGRVTIDIRVKAQLDSSEWDRETELTRQVSGIVIFNKFYPIVL